MGPLVRLRLRPAGVWTTPWQADTLLGAMACEWARSRGRSALRRDFLEPWLAGKPPFVVSDAFPGSSLPAPAVLPLWWDWPPEQRKHVKQTRWLSTDDFSRVQHGKMPLLETPCVTTQDHVRLRNAVSRATNGAGDRGELFEVPFSDLSRSGDAEAHLTIYARVARKGDEAVLMEALEMLGQTGYGADASVGHGAFEIDRALMPCPEIDQVPGADGFVALSTFQPRAGDPGEGFWRVFVKYGKFAPELHDAVIHKQPQVMIEPGACFRTGGAPKPFYGGPIGPERLLSTTARESLAADGVHPVQAAFALAVPIMWQGVDESEIIP